MSLHPGAPIVGDVLAEYGLNPLAVNLIVSATVDGRTYSTDVLLLDLASAASPAGRLLSERLAMIDRADDAGDNLDGDGVEWAWRLL